MRKARTNPTARRPRKRRRRNLYLGGPLPPEFDRLLRFCVALDPIIRRIAAEDARAKAIGTLVHEVEDWWDHLSPGDRGDAFAATVGSALQAYKAIAPETPRP